MVGVSPDKDIGAPDLPRVYVIRFSEPDFRPGFMRKSFIACHIGSGARVTTYKRAIADHFRISASSLRAEMAGPGGWAAMLGHTIDLVANEAPVRGVSPHVHILVCRLGEISEGNNNRRTFPGDGLDPIEFTMPHVATSFGAFSKMCRGLGFAAESAIG